MKNSMHFCFALIIALLGLNSAAFSATDIRDTLYPLYFENITTGEAPRAEREAQQEEWNYLMKFKMFGAEGIEFGNWDVRILDTVGWFGTATGDFKWCMNGFSKVGGPILIGGDMIFGNGPDTISSGPVRVNGDVVVQSEINFRSRQNVVTGSQCIGGAVSSAYTQFVPSGYLFNSTNCPDSVPEVKTDLKVPAFEYSAETVAAHGGLRNAIYINGAECSGARDGDGFCIRYIDVEEGEKQTPYDIYVEGISIFNMGKLVFRMQPGGRLTRVIFRDEFHLSSFSKIQVMYMNADATYSSEGWSGEGSIVENKDYAGNLLFYTQNDITFPSFNRGTDTLQGTFISQKTITIGQHAILAGQLLANKIVVDTDFDGSGFSYVPFNPAVMGLDFNELGSEGNHLVEGHAKDTVKIALDKKAKTQVNIEYCFAFGGTEEGVNWADEDDIDLTKDPSFPICGTSTKTASIAIGSTTLSTPIVVYVKDDAVMEDTERFTFRIVGISGARLSNGGSSDDFPIYIDDNEEPLLSTDGIEITVTEDTKFTFNKELFEIKDSDGDPWTGDFGIYVVTPPRQDSLRYLVNSGADVGLEEVVDYDRKIGGKYVGIPAGILDGSMGWNLIYNPPADAYGAKFDSLEYRVIRDGFLSNDTYTLYINILPVNDAPVAHDAEFTVPENSNEGVERVKMTGTIRVEDVDDKSFTYAWADIDDEFPQDVLDKIKDCYEIDASTGVIYAKGSDVCILNYEHQDSVLVGKVVVSDMGGGTTGASEMIETSVISVTLKIVDVNETPSIEVNQTFEISENATEGDVVKQTTAGATRNEVIASDPDLPTAKNDWSKFTYSIEDNKNFAIDSESGIITVKKNAYLDFEDPANNEFVVKVYVTDGGGLKDSASVTINVTDDIDIPKFADVKAQYDVDEHVSDGTVVALIEIKDLASNVSVTDFTADLKDDNIACGAVCAQDLFEASVVEDGGKLYYQVSVKDSALVNYEDLLYKSFDVTFTLKEGETTVTATTKIVVNDINEAHDIKEQTKFVKENLPKDTPVDTLSIIDPDTAAAFTSYTISIVNDTVPFVLDPSNNKIILVKDGAELNYEKDSVYTVIVAVTDKDFTDTATITIKLVDVNEPHFVSDETFDIPENSANRTVVGEIVVNDPDLVAHSKYTYKILSETEVPFKLDSNVIVVLDSNGLDYETNTSFSFKVEVKDDDFADTAAVTVSLTDVNESPRIVVNARDTDTVFVKEFSATGTKVLEYYVEDEDAGDLALITVSIQNLNSSGFDSLFTYSSKLIKDEDKYKLTVSVKDSSKLDAEKINGDHSIAIKVSDGTATDTIVRTINVYAGKRPPVVAMETFEVDENSAVGAVVGTLDYADYDITVVNGDTAVFDLSSAGVITTKVILDFETDDSTYVLVVKVADKEDDSYSSLDTVVIKLLDVNESPRIVVTAEDSDTVFVTENSLTGTQVMEYYVEDEDAGNLSTMVVSITDLNSSGFDSLFSYSTIKEGDKYKFVVAVADSSKLDYETIAHEHKIVITVKDAGGLTDSIVRTIMIVDVNEAPVVGNEVFDVAEHSPVGTIVGTLDYADYKISVVNGDTAVFDLSSDGVITTKKILDYEKDDSTYSLLVKVMDQDDSSCYSIDSVLVNLTDIEEIPPFITLRNYVVIENASDNTLIGTLEGSDGECAYPKACSLTYELLQASSYVTVDVSGVIRVKDGSLIDYEKMNSFTARVRVTNTYGWYSDTTITFDVRNLNEAPQIKDYSFSVYEDASVGTELGKLMAVDPDTNSAYNQLTYSILEKNVPFAISSTGSLTVSDPLDYEQKNVYTLHVCVTDGQYSDTSEVVVKIKDVDEPVVKYSAVEITKVVDGSTTFTNLDSVIAKSSAVDICWRSGYSIEGSIYWQETGCETVSLKEGWNIIFKNYQGIESEFEDRDSVRILYEVSAVDTTQRDPSKTDSVIVVQPVKNNVLAPTDVVYVNNTNVEIFETKISLETVKVQEKDFETLTYVKTSHVPLSSFDGNVIKSSNDDGTVAVTLSTKIKGIIVTISYTEDENGSILFYPVLDDVGDVNETPVYLVSYSAETTSGEKVMISYHADAVTGNVLYVDNLGNLTTNGTGLFDVSYEQPLDSENSVTVSYTVNQSYRIISDKNGSVGYTIAYNVTNDQNQTVTVVNRYVIDQNPPVVEIVYPKDGDAFSTDSIGVVWTVDGVEQDTLTVENLVEGLNWITRSYKDEAGNEGTVTICVYRNATPKERRFSDFLIERLLEKVNIKITLKGIEVTASVGTKVAVFDVQGNQILEARMASEVQNFELKKDQNYIVRVGKKRQMVRVR